MYHTNTVEGYYSIFKRGMKGVYQHCSEKHLHRYLAEFDFRYNNRSALGVNDLYARRNAAKGIVGKRLTYRRPHSIRETEAQLGKSRDANLSVVEAKRFMKWRKVNGGGKNS